MCRHILDRHFKQLLAVPQKTKVAGSVPGLALETDRRQFQGTRTLREDRIPAFYNTVSDSVTIAGEFLLPAQGFDNDMGMGGLGELSANQVTPEEKPDRQNQLLLDIHFIFVGRQLDKAVPAGTGLIRW